jgi:hypothetical protein
MDLNSDSEYEYTEYDYEVDDSEEDQLEVQLIASTPAKKRDGNRAN